MLAVRSIELSSVSGGVLGYIVFVARVHVNLAIHLLLDQIEPLFKDHLNVDANRLAYLASWERTSYLLLLVLGEVGPIVAQRLHELFKEDKVRFVCRRAGFQFLDETGPSRANFLVNFGEKGQNTILVHLLVKSAVVGIRLSRLPAVILLARIDTGIGWFVLPEVESLSWVNLATDPHTEVLVGENPIAIGV